MRTYKKRYLSKQDIVRNTQAFTIVEIMIIFMLITCLISIALPSATNSLAHFQTITTVRKLVADIEYTQQLAIRSEDTKASYEMDFYPLYNRYTIKHGAKTIRTENLPTWVQLVGTNLPQVSGMEILAFNTQGNPQSPGTIIITNGRTGKRYDIKIALLTGRIRVVVL